MISISESFEVISKDSEFLSQAVSADLVHCDDCHDDDFDGDTDCCLIKGCHLSFYLFTEKLEFITRFHNLFLLNWSYSNHYHEPFLKVLRKPPLYS
jgi:hypothetical protein